MSVLILFYFHNLNPLVEDYLKFLGKGERQHVSNGIQIREQLHRVKYIHRRNTYC